MSVTVLSDTTPRARKYHQCANCGQSIAPGQSYSLQKLAYEGQAYTWKSHHDCRQLALKTADDYGWDGIPPLIENEDFLEDLDYWRGRYPHVVCRIEFRRQTAEARWQKRQAAVGVTA